MGIVCIDDAIGKDNTELVFDRDCHEGLTWRGLAWCGSPGVARPSLSVVIMLGTRQSGQSRYGYHLDRSHKSGKGRNSIGRGGRIEKKK